MVSNISTRPNAFVSVVVPVGGNRGSDLNKITETVESLLRQDHGTVEVILVVEPTNTRVKSLQFSRPVTILDFPRPNGMVGRDTNARVQYGWAHARGNILGQCNATIIWRSDVVSNALKLMSTLGIDAVDGISRRMPKDNRSFIGIFQDEALITEFPLYKRDFVLTERTFAYDMRLPTFCNFLMTRRFYDLVKSELPTGCENGWEDFNIARAMVNCGGAIYCTNQLIAYRNHKLGLRLAKQFASGMSASAFYRSNPTNAYAIKRWRLYMFVASTFAAGLLEVPLLMIFIGFRAALLINILLSVAVMIWVGILNAIKANYVGALFFPPLTALQVFISTLGFLYDGIKETDLDQALVSWIHRQR